MSKILRTTLIVFGVLILAGGLAYAGYALGRANAQATPYSPGWMMSPAGTTGGYAFGPGWMMGRGRSGSGWGMGPGMMSGGYGYGYGANVAPLSLEQAEKAVQAYIGNLGIEGLKIHEIMIFDNQAYAEVVEESTGIGAFELLVNPVTQAVYPEHGPNMMWNLKYGGLNHRGMMGGMMGWNWNGSVPEVSAEMAVTPEQALEAAQKYLDAYSPGTTVSDEADTFYGYYTIHVLRDGKTIGMLSVNGFNAQVFYHYWHGNFIEMSAEE